MLCDVHSGFWHFSVQRFNELSFVVFVFTVNRSYVRQEVPPSPTVKGTDRMPQSAGVAACFWSGHGRISVTEDKSPLEPPHGIRCVSVGFRLRVGAPCTGCGRPAPPVPRRSPVAGAMAVGGRPAGRSALPRAAALAVGGRRPPVGRPRAT